MANQLGDVLGRALEQVRLALAGGGSARVIDEDINVPLPRAGLARQVGDLRLPGHIERQRQHIPLVFGAETLRRLLRVGEAARGEHQIAARLGQHVTHVKAEVARSADDHRHPAGQVKHLLNGHKSVLRRKATSPGAIA